MRPRDRLLLPRRALVSLSLIGATSCASAPPAGTPAPPEIAQSAPPQIAMATPSADRDGDGIPDARDKCPDAPEDCDGFEDSDGCPDLDNDKDRIPDTCDVCPNEPETYQGWGDRDGCPDSSGDIHRYRDHPANIFAAPLVWIRLAPGAIDPPAAQIDEAVSLWQTRRDRVEAITCVAQAAKDEKDPLRLSERRAVRTCEAIVKRGVPASIVAGAHGVGAHPMRSIEPESQREPEPLVIILVTRAEGHAIWTWNGKTFDQTDHAPENREPDPKDPRCSATWSPPPPPPPPGGCKVKPVAAPP